MHHGWPSARTRLRHRSVLGALSAVLAATATTGTALPPDEPAPPVPSTAAAPYALLHVDQHGHVARWDPCTTIRVRVNHADPRAPADAEALVTSALLRLEVASGLHLELVGDTTYLPYADTGVREPDADLVIAWTDAATVPALAGGVAGQGGAVWSTTRSASRIWRAHLVLDVDDALVPGFAPGRSVGTALLHELGHAVGLTHVDDPRQVMAAGLGDASRPVFQAGDLAGLQRVGAAAGCF
ncbi:matrixin family metalloprotease [Cellulomonas sp.]|uniref:matrixin family metalloprotease n=1 Tax=Cellulomonas sp. TaxID=40001 RepID=UPI001B127E72|nr:matrixin family metalloprotease [Cellulomonas sp.]MBO9553197.1 matrixin family metalloprotease [Cellulomonas sp.]